MPLTAKESLLFQRPELPYSVRCPIGMMDKFIRRRRFRDFTDRFMAVFQSMRDQNMQYFIGDDQHYFTQLFDLWFSVLERPNFQFEEGDEALFTLGGNIANILAVTPFRNGDACIKKIVGRDGSLAKILHLYTPRSRLQMPVKPLFDANPMLASLWYSSLWNWADCYIDEGVCENYKYFLDNMDDRFEPFDANLICGYFRCTYVDNRRDRALKRMFNASIEKYCSDVVIRNEPNPKSIAVVSAYWNGRHAVYRAFAPYIEEMSRHYDLTLVNMAPKTARAPVTEPFKKVVHIEANEERIDVSAIARNDFQLAYFPDVGMSQESMYLSNLRLAPIQAMGTGHPVSSASRTMDYFMSGAECEIAEGAEENYDERLVLMPGLSVHPIKPRYIPSGAPPQDRFVINCPWMHMKNNRAVAMAMRRIFDRAEREILFHVFPGCGASRNSAYMAVIQDYAAVLPVDSVVVMPDLKYEDYMERLTQGRFTLHSYPFGGGTTAVDALVMHKPLVVLRGRHEYNRYTAALLKRLGLEELVADAEDDWVRISVRLVNDPEYLERMTARVAEADLESRLFRVDDASSLRRSFDTLVRRHDEFKKGASRKPIRIE